MTDEGRREAALEELARAQEEVRAADHLLKLGMPRIGLTRACFPVFHAMRAVLYVIGQEPRTHRGTVALFNAHFVKTGRHPVSDARLVARLQRYREEADYAESFVIDDAGCREETAAAADFVARVATELEAELPPPTG